MQENEQQAQGLGQGLEKGLGAGLVKLAQIPQFDEIIDVRSPAEFAEDHLPGAINCPVLDDQERARVGTLYVQASPFVARKLGAALVARNIARHLETRLQDRPKSWRPLVYCWRGGQRSGAMTHILRQVGWDAQRLAGGYKAWRRQVVEDLQRRPLEFNYRVISGPTGSGKSRLLEALRQRGAQVLHLEELAAHKGSVLGVLPERSQPSQKQFETRLHTLLTAFDRKQPVFIESESRRIGRLALPDSLLQMIRTAPAWQLQVPLAARVDFLLQDYAYFLADAENLRNRLQQLRGLQANAVIAGWLELIAQQNHAQLVAELLQQHYDPLYARARQGRSCTRSIALEGLSPQQLDELAASLLAAPA